MPTLVQQIRTMSSQFNSHLFCGKFVVSTNAMSCIILLCTFSSGWHAWWIGAGPGIRIWGDFGQNVVSEYFSGYFLFVLLLPGSLTRLTTCPATKEGCTIDGNLMRVSRFPCCNYWMIAVGALESENCDLSGYGNSSFNTQTAKSL